MSCGDFTSMLFGIMLVGTNPGRHETTTMFMAIKTMLTICGGPKLDA
jgi:hypothetical protein